MLVNMTMAAVWPDCFISLTIVASAQKDGRPPAKRAHGKTPPPSRSWLLRLCCGVTNLVYEVGAELRRGANTHAAHHERGPYNWRSGKVENLSGGFGRDINRLGHANNSEH